MKLCKLNSLKAALIAVLAAPLAMEASQLQLEQLWTLAPDSRNYLTSSGHMQRGLAYNPITGHLLLVDRTVLAVYILDATDGAELGTLDLSAIAPGGNTAFPLNLIGVAEDGAIYAANLSNSTTAPHVNLYRWENETALQALIFNGDPSPGNAQRWGDTFDVGGSGTNTLILLGTRGNIAGLFSTEDLATFTATPLALEGAPGVSGYGITFAAGDTFWATPGASSGGPWVVYQFDRTNQTARIMNSFSSPILPAGLTPLDVDPARGFLAGLVIATPDRVDLYDVNDLDNAPVQFDSEVFPTDNANNVYAGSIQVTSNRVFVLNNNNGIVAYEVKSAAETGPEILVQPQGVTLSAGSDARLDVAVKGAAPMTYQWHLGTNALTGRTNSSLVLSNVQAAAVGDYRVTVTNAAGNTNSAIATVSLIAPPPPSRLEPLWSIAAGTRPYISTSGSNQRGMGYNPATDHVLIPNRSGGVSIPILAGTNGAEIGFMKTTGVSGGSVSLTQIAVAEDGVIYACNLVTTSGLGAFKIYRWENEEAELGLAFFDISSLEPQRWGDVFAVRGRSNTTEILLAAGTGNGAGTGTTLALLSTTDGISFTAIQLTSDAPAFSFSHGLAFGQGDTFWGKALSGPLYQMSFNRETGAATVLKTYDAVAPEVGPIGISLQGEFVGGVAVTTPDKFLLFEFIGNALTNIAEAPFPSDNGNSTGTGAVHFGADKVFVYDTNNGLMAFRIAPKETTPAPRVGIRWQAGKAMLSWPATAQGFTLQNAPALSGQTAWTASSAVPVREGDQWTATVDPTGAAQFFRLAK